MVIISSQLLWELNNGIHVTWLRASLSISVSLLLWWLLKPPRMTFQEWMIPFVHPDSHEILALLPPSVSLGLPFSLPCSVTWSLSTFPGPSLAALGPSYPRPSAVSWTHLLSVTSMFLHLSFPLSGMSIPWLPGKPLFIFFSSELWPLGWSILLTSRQI